MVNYDRFFDRFTEDARHALAEARHIAQATGASFIGIPHLVAALLPISRAAAEGELQKVELKVTSVAPGKLPFTPNLKRAIDIAAETEEVTAEDLAMVVLLFIPDA